MPKRYIFKTPLGEFASTSQAAKAHHCDPSTILNRCATQPELYSRTEVPPEPKKPRVKFSPSKATNTTWPITWYQYKFLPDEVREGIFNHWCSTQRLNPDTEEAVDKFFNDMDQYQEQEPEDEQVI